MQQDDKQKNLLLAVALSAIVLIGWQLLFVNPRIKEEQARRASQTQSQPVTAQPGQQPATGTPVPATAPSSGTRPGDVPLGAAAPTLTREAAIAASPRVAIETPAIKGTISLKGARIDDIELAQYHEETDPKSPLV
ncbi:MAG: membrane protein insertase YidC, partial [Proteobacteria bacterium]|nr:membrane protein insertase YidC [Pseudomonadota bacterium]